MMTAKKAAKKKTKKKATKKESVPVAKSKPKGLAAVNLAALEANIKRTLEIRESSRNLRSGSIADRMAARRELNSEISKTLNDNLRRRANNAEKQQPCNDDGSTGPGAIREVASPADVREDPLSTESGGDDPSDSSESENSLDPFE